MASQDAAPPGLVDLEEELDEAVGALAKKLTGNWTALEGQVRQVRHRWHCLCCLQPSARYVASNCTTLHACSKSAHSIHPMRLMRNCASLLVDCLVPFQLSSHLVSRLKQAPIL